jgi:hypothetical protein
LPKTAAKHPSLSKTAAKRPRKRRRWTRRIIAACLARHHVFTHRPHHRIMLKRSLSLHHAHDNRSTCQTIPVHSRHGRRGVPEAHRVRRQQRREAHTKYIAIYGWFREAPICVSCTSPHDIAAGGDGGGGGARQRSTSTPAPRPSRRSKHTHGASTPTRPTRRSKYTHGASTPTIAAATEAHTHYIHICG